MTSQFAKIPGLHCESCGRTEDTELTVIDGYTECCNEPACDGTYDTAWNVGTFGEQPGDHTVTGSAAGCCAAAVKATLPAGLFVLGLIERF